LKYAQLHLLVHLQIISHKKAATIENRKNIAVKQEYRKKQERVTKIYLRNKNTAKMALLILQVGKLGAKLFR